MFANTNSNPLLFLTFFMGMIVVVIAFFSSPDWVIVALSAAILLWQIVMSLRYFVMKSGAGILMTRIPNHRRLPNALIGAICATVSAILFFFEPSDIFSLLKAYSLQLLFLGFAILSLVAVFQYTEIRENGILLDTGDFYHWKDVESFDWAKPEQRLLLRLRNFFLKKQVKLAIHSYYKKEIAESFEQYTRNNYAG
jgi:hypothetical protein